MPRPIISDNVVSVDKGNGMAELWAYSPTGYKTYSIPNGRVSLNGFEFDKDVAAFSRQDIIKVRFLGDLFAIGPGIWEQSTNPVETYSDSAEQYASTYHIMLTLSLLALAKIDDATPVKLILSVPPKIVSLVSKDMKRAYKRGSMGTGDGKWTIEVRGKVYEYTIQRVIVVPEGTGAYAAFAFDANGNPVRVESSSGHDLLSGNVYVNDGGRRTYDVLNIVNGNIAQESIIHSSDHTFGVAMLILKPVREYIAKHMLSRGIADYNIQDAQIDAWLINWTSSGKTKEAANVIVGGEPINLHALYTATCQRAAEMVIRQKIAPQFASGADTVVLAGGLWVYIEDHVRDHFEGRNIIGCQDVEHLRGLHSWQLNAYGGLVLAAVLMAENVAQI